MPAAIVTCWSNPRRAKGGTRRGSTGYSLLLGAARDARRTGISYSSPHLGSRGPEQGHGAVQGRPADPAHSVRGPNSLSQSRVNRAVVQCGAPGGAPHRTRALNQLGQRPRAFWPAGGRGELLSATLDLYPVNHGVGRLDSGLGGIASRDFLNLA